MAAEVEGSTCRNISTGITTVVDRNCDHIDRRHQPLQHHSEEAKFMILLILLILVALAAVPALLVLAMVVVGTQAPMPVDMPPLRHADVEPGRIAA